MSEKMAGYPIGSGEVEATNKVLVTSGPKRSGQSWWRNGGQGAFLSCATEIWSLQLNLAYGRTQNGVIRKAMRSG